MMIRHHITRWSAAILVLGLSACQTIQFERPQVLSETDWPTDGQTESRSRAVDASLSLPLALEWEYNANAGFGPASPLVLQDRVLVGNRKGEIHSVEIGTGKGRGFKQMGESVEGSALIHDGTLYVPVAWGKRIMIAFDLTKGTNRWRKRGVPFATALLGHRDSVVGVDLEGTLKAYSTRNGEELWSMELASYRTFKAFPVRVSESSVVFADITGQVYRVNLDTQEVEWTTNLGSPVYETPAAAEDRIAISSTRGTLHLLDATSGEAVWTWEGPEHIRMGAPALGSSEIIAGATDGHVRAFDRATGAVRWETEFDDVVSAAPLVAGSHVFVGTLGQELAALDLTTGENLWQTEVEGRIKSAMAVAEGGLLVLTEPRWVLYFKPSEEVSATEQTMREDQP